VSNSGGEIQSTKLSVNEARQVLRSIQHACDLNDVVKIKVGELTWTTDARLGSKDAEDIVIKFDGPGGFVRTPAKRKDVTAAMTEFVNRFGPN